MKYSPVVKNKSFQISSLFLIVFLVNLSMGAFMFSSCLSIPTYIIALLSFSIAFVGRKISDKTLLTLSITAVSMHLIAPYVLLPVGLAGDHRVFFIDVILKFGIQKLIENYSYTGLYYVTFPVMWLNASVFRLITSFNPDFSLLITIIIVYIVWYTFLVILAKIKGISISSIIFASLLIVYIHRPFMDLLSDSNGILATTILIYLLLLSITSTRTILFLLLLFIPLFIAHALSIYISIALLLCVAMYILLFKLQRRKNIAYKLFSLSIFLFLGTYVYQIAAMLLNDIILGISGTGNQLLAVLREPLLVRPVTTSLVEQNLRYVYSFDPYVTYLSYGLPLLISLISLVYFTLIAYKYKETEQTYIPFLFLAMILFTIAAVYGYKGLENAVARYAYEYASAIALMPIAYFIDEISFKYKIYSKIFIFVLTSLIFISLTESLFTPYSSVIAIPDRTRFITLMNKYYWAVMYNPNLIGKMFPQFLSNIKPVTVDTLYKNLSQTSIIWSDGKILSDGKVISYTFGGK
jgi:hypothetical protein